MLRATACSPLRQLCWRSSGMLASRVQSMAASGRASKRSGPRAAVEGVEFKVTAEEAVSAFSAWSRGRIALFGRQPDALQAVYAPYWAFDLKVLVQSPAGEREARYCHDSSPAAAAAALVYGGHHFRREMMDVGKVPLLAAEPWRGSMLSSAALRLGGSGSNGAPIASSIATDRAGQLHVQVDDAWGVWEATALALAKSAVHREELRIAQAASPAVRAEDVHVRFHVVSSRRVLLPLYVAAYERLGTQWRAFISGVSGEVAALPVEGALSSALAALSSFNSFIARRTGLDARLPLSQLAAAALLRALPKQGALLMAAAALVMAARGALRSFASLRRQRRSFAEWEATKAEERSAQLLMPQRAAQEWRFARGRELAPWERARQPRTARARAPAAEAKAKAAEAARAEERKRAATRAAERAQLIRRGAAVDLADAHAVLQLSKRVRLKKADVRSAFREQLMLWHPDHHAEASAEEKAVLSARTAAIVDAYRTLRASADK